MNSFSGNADGQHNALWCPYILLSTRGMCLGWRLKPLKDLSLYQSNCSHKDLISVFEYQHDVVTELSFYFGSGPPSLCDLLGINFFFKLSPYPELGASEGRKEQVAKGEMLVPESMFSSCIEFLTWCIFDLSQFLSFLYLVLFCLLFVRCPLSAIQDL